MKKIFVVSTTYTKSLEEVGKFRKDHFKFIQKYIDAEKFIAGGRQNPPIGGLILAYNVTRKEIEEILKEDPYYKNNLIETEITEFTPALLNKDFEKFSN
jgi:YCII-like protein